MTNACTLAYTVRCWLRSVVDTEFNDVEWHEVRCERSRMRSCGAHRHTYQSFVVAHDDQHVDQQHVDQHDYNDERDESDVAFATGVGDGEAPFSTTMVADHRDEAAPPLSIATLTGQTSAKKVRAVST